MAVGVFIGYRLRHLHRIHKVTSLIQVVVCLLLFILGLSIGNQQTDHQQPQLFLPSGSRNICIKPAGKLNGRPARFSPVFQERSKQ